MRGRKCRQRLFFEKLATIGGYTEYLIRAGPSLQSMCRRSASCMAENVVKFREKVRQQWLRVILTSENENKNDLVLAYDRVRFTPGSPGELARSDKETRQTKPSSGSSNGQPQTTSANEGNELAPKSSSNFSRPLPPLPPSEQDLVVGAGLSRCSSADSFSSDSDLVHSDPNSRGASVSPLREVAEKPNFEEESQNENNSFPQPPPVSVFPTKPAKETTAARQNGSALPSPPSNASPLPPGLELSRQLWYRRLNRRDAERFLQGCGDDGRYLVRPSNHGGADSPYTLSLIYRQRVYHILVRQRPDGQYALGKEKDKEVTFSSVPLLIAHYRTEPLQLQQQDGVPGDKACLTLPPP